MPTRHRRKRKLVRAKAAEDKLVATARRRKKKAKRLDKQEAAAK